MLLRRLIRSPFWQIVAALLLGLVAGRLYPQGLVVYRASSDGFVKVLRLLITPIVFVTVSVGVGSVGDLRKAGRTGLKALIYFEAASTVALVIGLVAAHLLHPGGGLRVDPSTLAGNGISATVKSAASINAVDFILGLIPAGVAAPFVDNQLLQVLLLAVLFGIALSKLGAKAPVLSQGLAELQRALFVIAGLVMRFLAPIAVFGATAFAVAQYGFHSLLSFASILVCLYLADAVFVFGVLGLISRIAGLNLWAFLRYIKEEILLVGATSTSELAIPPLMKKLEHLGCARSTVGIVLPAGYSFNMDGSSIYMSVGLLFLVQATHTPLPLGREILVLLLMLLTSKGAAGVPGMAFVALAATLSAYPVVPLNTLALLLGVTRFMSMAGAMVNMIGNGVATIVVDKWEGTFDSARARRVLAGEDRWVDLGD